jgi:hypothetical protein
MEPRTRNNSTTDSVVAQTLAALLPHGERRAARDRRAPRDRRAAERRRNRRSTASERRAESRRRANRRETAEDHLRNALQLLTVWRAGLQPAQDSLPAAARRIWLAQREIELGNIIGVPPSLA